MARAIILAPNGYNGGTVEVYSEPVGFTASWHVGPDGIRQRAGGYFHFQCVHYPVVRELTLEQYHNACADAGVEAFL